MARGIQSQESLLEELVTELKRLNDFNERPGLIRGEYWESDAYPVPGVGTAAIYADLDQFGTEFRIPTPPVFQLMQIDFIDPDDEGIAMRVWLARDTMGATSVDNGALVIPDGHLARVYGDPITIAATAFGDANTGQIGTKANIERLIRAPNGVWVQLQSGGAPTIAVGAVPSIRLKGLC